MEYGKKVVSIPFLVPFRNMSCIFKQSSLILVIMDLHSFWTRVEGERFNLQFIMSNICWNIHPWYSPQPAVVYN